MIDLLFFILIFLFLSLIWGFFILKIVKAHKRLDIEAGKKLIHSTTGGGRIGQIRHRGFLINLRIYDEFLVIASVQVLILNYKDIERVEIKKWLVSIPNAIQIVHSRYDIPRKIIIATTKPSYLKKIIDSKLSKKD